MHSFRIFKQIASGFKKKLKNCRVNSFVVAINYPNLILLYDFIHRQIIEWLKHEICQIETKNSVMRARI